MSRPLAVLRPAPGNEATARRIEAAGYVAIRLPLFEIVGLEWTPPDPAAHDALVLTSANAVRHAGPALVSYTALPVYAVGEATAAAARAAGLAVAAIGDVGVEALLERARELGVRRAIHLAGNDRSHPELPPVTATVAVYASLPRRTPAKAGALDMEALRSLPSAPAFAGAPLSDEELAQLSGSVALLHSQRAAARLGELISERAGVAIAAISGSVASAAGAGWRAVAVAGTPDDSALIAAAATLAD